LNILRDLSEVCDRARGGALSIGNFDGVHLGHARIVEQLIQQAHAVGGPAVVFTFDPHPVQLLRPDQCPPPLTWTERKAELLGDLGVDWMVAYPTDQRMLRRTPCDFFQFVVLEQLVARAMVEGPNFFFGHNRAGTIEVLRELTDEAAIPLTVVEPYAMDGQYVSSSRIRQLISRGEVRAARAMLTQPYRIRGMVTHGARRGQKIGFPTANLHAIDTLLPAEGVYAGRARFNGHLLPAAINLGANPTFGESTAKVEVHVVGWDGPLYGQPLEVDFLERLRDIQPFPSPAALKEQLERDVKEAEAICGQS